MAPSLDTSQYRFATRLERHSAATLSMALGTSLRTVYRLAKGTRTPSRRLATLIEITYPEVKATGWGV